MELVIDSFAGGGGASTGIEAALGRAVDVAINHDADAIRMHAVNHPDTEHLNSNIYHVDPRAVRPGQPIGLLWASPDCTHHSKAKGGVPIRPEGRNSRDLAWVIVQWAELRRPRVIMMENVEEWRGWGPLVQGEDNQLRPCPDRKGAYFEAWKKRLKRLGYRIEMRELRGCDYGAPTIRKRLFVIARCDGEPIVWPEPTHGAPDDPDVIAGRKLPWRTAGEIIDWSLPCPSIFMDREQARAYTAATGIRVNRPLAENTMKRIARGVKRYVLDAAEPFLVSVAHGDSGGRREYPLGEPIGTATVRGVQHALVAPVIAPVVTHAQQGGRNRDAAAPLHTVCASAKDQNAVIAPVLVPRYGERDGQEPRCRTVEAPSPAIVPTGNGAQLVAAFLAQHNTGLVGHDSREPLSTIVTKGCTQAVAAAHMINMKGSQRSARAAGDPLSTATAGAAHAGVVAAFMQKYYGTEQDPRLEEALHTVTTKDRFGLVTVTLDGEPWVIVDIGMRMLTPRELFSAQGFPPGYVIEADAQGRAFTKSVQTRCVGNSVCPPVAEALVRANVALREAAAPPRVTAGPLFGEAA